jgi:hypothetical protein
MLAFSSPSTSAEALSAEESEQIRVRAQELVKELGDPRFRIREAAAKELKSIGRHAKPALREGMLSGDPEVVNRCSQLLPEILALDLKARVEAFLADVEGKQEHDLPMRSVYQQIAGNDAAARNLYASIIRGNSDFLEFCEQNPRLAGERYNIRGMEIQQQLLGSLNGERVRLADNNGKLLNTSPIVAADVAALFLVGANAEVSKAIVNPVNGNVVANLLWQQPVQAALQNGEQAVPFRKLFFAWADQRNDVNTISVTLSLIQNLNLKDGIDYAVRVVKTKDQQIWTRAQALTCIGKLGGKEQLTSIEALFDDKTQVTAIQWNQVHITTQLGDIALAMAVHLSGQQHKEYGFDALQSQPSLLWAYHYLGFSTDEKRTTAFKKYEKWSADQKKN